MEFLPERCVTYKGVACQVCAKACPVGERALVIDSDGHPVLKLEGCVGCGSCVKACITSPVVVPVPAGRRMIFGRRMTGGRAAGNSSLFHNRELGMQVIIPLAGKGTRLRPHTHLVPKPMLKVAGRPVMDWVMDRLHGLDVTELIFITGHLKEQVEAYSSTRYGFPARFIEQKVQDGTAGAVNLARPYVDGPVLIIFVDTVFEADLTLINRTDADGIIWAKEVEDYQRFGVVVTDADGYMTKIVEKPKEPISKLANIGLYYIKAVDSLWQGIDHVLARARRTRASTTSPMPSSA